MSAFEQLVAAIGIGLILAGMWEITRIMWDYHRTTNDLEAILNATHPYRCACGRHYASEPGVVVEAYIGPRVTTRHTETRCELIEA